MLGSKRKRKIFWIHIHSRWKLAVMTLLAVMLIAAMSYEWPASKTWTYWTLPLSGKTIAIDAGHGGPDGGASSKEGIIEKDITLAISLYLRDYLQQAGALVVMTREDDTDLADKNTKGLSRRKTEDLHARADYVNKSNASMLLSIHLNSIPSPKWYGAQTFYNGQNENNRTLATLIQNEIKRTVSNTDRVAKPVDKNVYVLQATSIPAALVEVGFLSNPEEARKLAKPEYQKQLAAAIYQGILRYESGEKVAKP